MDADEQTHQWHRQCLEDTRARWRRHFQNDRADVQPGRFFVEQRSDAKLELGPQRRITDETTSSPPHNPND